MLKWPQTTNTTFWLHAKSASVRMMLIDRKRRLCKNRTVEVPNLELRNKACVVHQFGNKFSVLSLVKRRASRVVGRHLLAGDKYQRYVSVILAHPLVTVTEIGGWVKSPPCPSVLVHACGSSLCNNSLLTQTQSL